MNQPRPIIRDAILPIEPKRVVGATSGERFSVRRVGIRVGHRPRSISQRQCVAGVVVVVIANVV